MPKRGQQHPEETGKVEWWESIRWQMQSDYIYP